MNLAELDAQDRLVSEWVLERRWIDEASLQDCLQERWLLRHSGNDVPLPQILLHRGLLTTPQYVELASDLSKPAIRVGPYRPIREIARGGMGRVFAAVDVRDDRPVALKIVRADEGEDDLAASLRREAAIAARFRHPNVIEMLDAGKVRQPGGDWLHYLAMELVDGDVLEDCIQTTNRNRPHLLGIFAQLARTVSYVHSQRVLHLDVKPSNVLLRRTGEIVLTDFGLARGMDSDDSSDCEIRGTPAYMSPEQILGRTEEIDARTDIYSLGVVLYEILTGRLPYRAEDWGDLHDQIVLGVPLPPREIRPDVPSSLERICLRAMANRADDRYASASELARDVERTLESVPRAVPA